jgi:uroporphyrinogen-III synthase
VQPPARSALPLEGLVVGVSADRRSGEQMELLRRRGARVVHGPTVRTLHVDADEGLRAATEAVIADPPDLVVLSTGLGVRSWAEAADSIGLGAALMDAVDGATVLARGPKAYGAAVTAGWHVDWKAPGASSAEVLAHLAELGVSGRRVAVQLDGRSDPVLAESVASLGAQVVAVPVYRWVLPEDTEPASRLIDSICDGALDAVTFTSSPAVWNLTAMARSSDRLAALRERLSSDVIAVCVGPICAATAAAAGFTAIVQPERARLGPMVQTYAAHVSRCRRRVQVDRSEVLMGAAAIVVDGHVIELTRRERDVMGVLAARPGSVVDKAQLLQQVWQGGADDHAVEVTVGRLRRRLAGSLSIQTVHRRGYRLVPAAVDPDAS